MLLLLEDMTEWYVSIKRSVNSLTVRQKFLHRCLLHWENRLEADLIVLFTNTVSHKMVRCAVEEAEKCNANVVRCHTSSKNALEEILENTCA